MQSQFGFYSYWPINYCHDPAWLAWFNQYHYPQTENHFANFQRVPISSNCEAHVPEVRNEAECDNKLTFDVKKEASTQKIENPQIKQEESQSALVQAKANQKIEKRPTKARKIKKTPKSTLVQKEGRNTYSNIFRKFFKLVNDRQDLRPLVEKVTKLQGLHIESQEFFQDIQELDIDHRNYIREKQVSWMYSEPETPSKIILRILFHNYMRNFYVPHLLSSKKTNERSFDQHLKALRTLLAASSALSRDSSKTEIKEKQAGSLIIDF